jgi:hypothetical protein
VDSANNKTSFLVASQLPEFVRRDHPRFVEFVENYYKFLEQNGQMLYTAKKFDDFYDIDVISGANNYTNLQQKYYDNFIKYIPSTSLADLDLILKHSKDFYRSTGSGKSVKFIARILFNKNADLVRRFHVDGIPHVALLKSNGEIQTSLIGAAPKKILLDDMGLTYICATAERFYSVV